MPYLGAGSERVILSTAMADEATMPYIGRPIWRASSAVAMTWTPAPCDSTEPAQVSTVGRDISCGSRPFDTSTLELTVAFILANPKEASSWKSSVPLTRHILVLPQRIDSAAESKDSTPVAQTPTGVLIGPAAPSKSMFTHAAGLLAKPS